MTTNRSADIASRQNPNHHLWNNHGTWWCHFTLHLPDFTKHRVRLSLDTREPAVARSLRDSLLALFHITVAPATASSANS